MSRFYCPGTGLRITSAGFLLAALALTTPAGHSQGTPGLRAKALEFTEGGDIEIFADVPSGLGHAVLEVIPEAGAMGDWQPWVSGPLTGESGQLRFTIPDLGSRGFARVRVGSSSVVPPATYSGLDFMSPSYGDGGFYIAESSKAVHVLNRLGYGPSPVDMNQFLTDGAETYIFEQLFPGSIDESGNDRLNQRVAALFHDILPYGGEAFVAPGHDCRFFRGVSEPPTDWADEGFADGGWEFGVTGVGYGDGDDATVLDDMRYVSGADPPQPGYLSYYLRLDFDVADPLAIDNLVLRMIYDDSFVAYINGTEVARENVGGTPPAYNTAANGAAGNVDNSSNPGEWVINSAKALLNTGPNVLAIQIHNANLTSSDASAIPSLLNISSTPYTAIRGPNELQHLLHLRGIYSRRQLQAALAEFWENHFTTDFDKVEDYLLELEAFETLADMDEDRAELQARIEAASLEYDEYQFFYDNALGDFGNLLLYSAASPTMLIYLDSVLNRKNAPNENYSREIFELHTHGDDNGYTQFDIEELARCFTGWTIRKVKPGDKLPFPQSARTPPITPSLTVDTETAIVDAGATWDYFPGTAEPTPGGGGEATTDWAQEGFLPGAGWLSGPSGFGYGDGDDLTELTGMQNNYVSVYIRTEFLLDPGAYEALVLEIDYDDGYVAYLNGTEISRSYSMRNNGTPPAYDETADSHEAGNPKEIDLAPYIGLFNDAATPNVLAVQGHNTGLTSSDFTLIPRLLGRSYTADSIAESAADGVWTFRFDPDEHDYGSKVIFDGAPYQINIPDTRTGIDGVDDAIDVIDALVDVPPTAEFICLKLVNRFVSDEITLESYHDRSAPDWLLTIMDDAIVAWGSTSPAGNIATVMESILDPTNQTGGFWLEGAQFSKIKTPIEFINSGFRALDADVVSESLPDRNEDMGMELIRRDDPDGFSENGSEWIDTLGLLERMKFSQALGIDDAFSRSAWDIDTMLANNAINTPDDLINHFDTLLFGGKLSQARRAVFIDFADTNDAGASSPFDSLGAIDKVTRLRQLTGLILATPEFQYQ